MTMPRVLVTGAAGRLGSTIATRFHDAGYPLLATDVVAADDVPYRFEIADLRDHDRTRRLLADADVVLHIGNHPGVGSHVPQEVFNDNVTMNGNVFQGAAECGVGTVVFASTLQVIGSHPDERTVTDPPTRPPFPISGETVPAPANVYALSKTVSEIMLRYYAERCGLHATALRFPLLHHGDDRVRVGHGDERPVDVFEGFTGLTYDDAARLCLAVVDADLPGYHVFMAGTSHRHRDLPLRELIRRFYPDTDPDLADLIDIGALAAATGWQPTTTFDSSGRTP